MKLMNVMKVIMFKSIKNTQHFMHQVDFCFALVVTSCTIYTILNKNKSYTEDLLYISSQ